MRFIRRSPGWFVALTALVGGLGLWVFIGGYVLVSGLLKPPTPLIPTPLPNSPVPISTAIAVLPSETPTVLADTATPTLILPSLTVQPTETKSAETPTPLPLIIGQALTADTATPIDLVSPTVAATSASSAPVTVNGCTPPQGWVAYQIEEGDTLFGFQLGADSAVTVDQIMTANCLQSKLLSIGQVLFLPAGVAAKSPKVDDVSDPSPGNNRQGNCPCTLRVREGWRLEQIAAALDKLPVGFTGSAFLAAAGPNAPSGDRWFLAGRPAGKSLEGFMFPGTYTLESSTTAAEFREMLLNAFAANVDSGLAGSASARGYTFWQAVNLASIIQRESYDANEQTLISGVMWNRMNANKGLGATVTTQYALGVPGNWWPRVIGGMINTDSPYNTNLYRGLPPAPISNPGLSAIYAAVNPAQHEYLYFSAKCGGGGNFYARTFEEFKVGLNCGG